MITYTLYDYFKVYAYISRQREYLLNDNKEVYKLENNDVVKNKRHNKHDKLFRDILNNKREIVKLVNKYVRPKEEITVEMIEKYDTKFLTNVYEEKEADIVFKLKDKEVFFLLEHQTKVDNIMSYRILEYSLEIIRTRMRNIKGQIEKVGIPKIIPLVIYTGQAKWTAKESLEEVQTKFEHLKGIDIITGYNLIDIRNEDQAIEDGSAIARMSVIERKNGTEDIIEFVKRMSKKIEKKEERQEFAKEIKYLLSDRLIKEEIEKIEEILIKKEGDEGMLHAQMVIRRDFERAKEEGREEGRKEGILHAQEVIKRDFERAKEEGRKEGKMTIARKMLDEKIDIEIISKITGVEKEELLQNNL